MSMKKILIRTLLALTIIPLIYRQIRKWHRKRKIRKEIMEDGHSDFGSAARNIALSISQAKALSKSLLVKIHPDRMPVSKIERATALAARISESKRNYEGLKALEIEVEALLAEPEDISN